MPTINPNRKPDMTSDNDDPLTARDWIVGWAGLIAIILVLSAIVTVFTPDDKPAAQANVPQGATAGSLDLECEFGLFNDCSDKGGSKNIRATDVYCQWQGPNVIAHVRITSSFNARLDVGVIPRYVIQNGGQHGTAASSQVTQTIEPQGESVFAINAGHPKGVLDGTSISECKPKLFDVKIAG